jgi:hypothetical protein
MDLLAVGYTFTLSYTQYKQYSAITQLHHLQTTVAHALGFPISTSHLLATALNTETIRVLLNHTLQMLLHYSTHEVFTSHFSLQFTQFSLLQL